MNLQKASRTLLVLIASLFLITTYQNCAAPAENSILGSTNYDSEGCLETEPNCVGDGQAQSVKESLQMNLSGGNSLIVPPPSDVLEVRGECYVEPGYKSSINWVLYMPGSTVVRQSGTLADNACVQGQFAFDIELLNTYANPFNYNGNHRFTLELVAEDADGTLYRNSLLAFDEATVSGF